jgi:hypothetical protein
MTPCSAGEKRSAELAALYGFSRDRILRKITAIALVPVGHLELKGADKLKSLELLAKFNKMFPGERVASQAFGHRALIQLCERDCQRHRSLNRVADSSV